MKNIDFIVIFFITLFVYADSMRVDFMWDDEYIVKRNEAIRSINIKNFFNLSYWKEFRKYTSPFEIPLKPVSPLRQLSLQIDYKIWVLNPVGYHLTNLILHILTAFVVYILLYNIVNSRELSLISAVLFAINPILTETVIWIKNRIDIIATLFYLLSFLFFVKWYKVKKIVFFALSFVFFVLSIFSKEISITLPIIMVMYVLKEKDNYKEGFKDSIRLIYPFIIITFLYLLFQKYIVEADKVALFTASYFKNLYQHIYTVFITIVYYLGLLVFPYNQIAERYLYKPESLFDLKGIASVLFVLLYICVLVYMIKKDKNISFFMLWILITLLPVSNIIYLSTRPIAEHRLYLPSIGFVFILSSLLIRFKSFLKSSSKKEIEKIFKKSLFPLPYPLFPIPYTLIVLFLFASYGYSTMKRVYEWRDAVSFWQSTEKKSVPNYRTYLNLGISYLAKNEKDKAIDMLSKAGEIMPEDPYVLNALGVVYLEMKEYDLAINVFQRSVLKYPDFDNAVTNLGWAYYFKGLDDYAIKTLERAKTISQTTLPSIYLSEIYKRKGDIKKAEKEFLYVLEKENYPWDIHKSFIEMYEKKNMWDKAIEEYEKAVKINPYNIWAYNGLALAYIHKGKYLDAENMFKKALEIDPGNTIIKRNIKELEVLKEDLKRNRL